MLLTNVQPGIKTEQRTEREMLLAKIARLKDAEKLDHQRKGYQLGGQDAKELDKLIQKALALGCQDTLTHMLAIRTAYQIHGKVSFEQMKLLKEVSLEFSKFEL